MFYKVPEFPDKMSTDHEDQVLGKQRPGWQNGPRRGPTLIGTRGRDWKDSGWHPKLARGKQIISTTHLLYYASLW